MRRPGPGGLNGDPRRAAAGIEVAVRRNSGTRSSRFGTDAGRLAAEPFRGVGMVAAEATPIPPSRG